MNENSEDANGKNDKNKYDEIFYKRSGIQLKRVFRPASSTDLIDKKIKFDGKVMDFGSMIDSLNYKKTVRDGGQYYGFDIDGKTVEWLKENNFYIDFWNTNERFDVIIATQVYEHLDKEMRDAFIKKSYELLNEKGLLIIEYPHIRNLGGMNYWTDRTHVQPPAVEDEAIMLRMFGFKTELYLAGISYWPPQNFLRMIANMLIGLHPQHNVVIFGMK